MDDRPTIIEPCESDDNSNTTTTTNKPVCLPSEGKETSVLRWQDDSDEEVHIPIGETEEEEEEEEDDDTVVNRGENKEEEEQNQLVQMVERGEETFEEFVRARPDEKRIKLTSVIRDDQTSEIDTSADPTSLVLTPPHKIEVERKIVPLSEALDEVLTHDVSAAIFEESYKAVESLKEQGILDRYILNDDEAAVLCAIPKLIESAFDFKALFQSCRDKAPCKLVVLMLKSLRKVPWHKGTLYFGRECDKPIKRRKTNSVLCYPFLVASSSTSNVKESLDKSKYREILRVDDCWGYDISDFVSYDGKTLNQCKQT